LCTRSSRRDAQNGGAGASRRSWRGYSLGHLAIAAAFRFPDAGYRNPAASETTTDGIPDDNGLQQLGGGVTLGYAITRKLGAQVSCGDLLYKNDNSHARMWRLRATYVFSEADAIRLETRNTLLG
jgi:hypothetical protein